MAGGAELGPSTRAVHAGSLEPRLGEALTTPIYQTTTFHAAPDGSGEVRYTRYGNNPNHLLLERRLCALEGAEACATFGSGMGAMTAAVLACVKAGEHVLAARALYGGTRTLLDTELARLGIATTLVDFSQPGWREEIRPETRLFLLEMPSNPLMRVPDLAPAVAAAREAGAAVVVDVTFATPINFRALEHKVDLVVHSATKYLGGHSDVTAGVVCGGSRWIAEVRQRARTLGAALDPHAAWLLERGLKTLALRMQRHNENALRIARWLETQPGVARVHHPGLESHPDYEVAARLLDGYGGMLSVDLAGGGEAATRMLGALRLAQCAPSLGGVETLVSQPRHTSHAALSPEERTREGITDGLIRFSIGIEDAEDLIADLEQALRSAR